MTQDALRPLVIRICRILATFVISVCICRAAAAAPLPPPPLSVLIDGVHANDLTTVGLAPGVYEYHATTGCRRSFEYLRARGVATERMTEGRLTAERLASHRLLFVNLVSAERPPWYVPEIVAVRRYLEQGGSLLRITDHTNCYYHAWRLAPLLAELGIEVFTDAACDVPPFTLGNGSGWIRIRQFEPHLLTAGIACLGLQTGGCVDPRSAVAWTSPGSWADAWTPSPFGQQHAPGFFGNYQRDPGERSGPLGAALATNVARGRVVIIADQNLIGESFLHYEDNYRLWLNALAWLLHDPALADAEAYQRWRSPRLVLYEPLDRAEFGCDDPDGLYRAFVLLSRSWWTFAARRWAEPASLLVFGYNDCRLPPEDAAAVARHLRGGRHVLILNADSQFLDDEASVVAQVLLALGASGTPPRDTHGKLVYEPAGCGRIEILGPDVVLDNGVLGLPAEPPDEKQTRRDGELLDAVRALVK